MRGQQVIEQAQLGGEVIFERRVIVHVVAGDVGETATENPDAIEAMLVQTVAGGFDRQMIDTVGFQLGQQFVNLHRIRRGVRQRHHAVRRDHAHGAQAGGGLAQRGPDFAQERDDGRLTLGAGDGGDCLGLRVIKSGGVARQAQAWIFGRNKRHAQRRDVAFQRGRAQHGAGAARHRVLHEFRAVGFRPGQGREQIAGFDLAAVAGQTCEVLHARHSGFRMWRHRAGPSASLVETGMLGTPSSGAMRWIMRPACGAAVQPAVAKPNVSLVDLGWSIRTRTT